MKRYAVALLSAALTVPIAAVADPVQPPAMYPDATNAALPDARDNLGIGSGQSAVYYAKDYAGCIWDASHDVGTCINSAITAASAGGGGTVTVPAGILGLSTTIDLLNGVRVVGAGGANYGQCATTLKWLGASSGVMVSGGSDSAAHQVAGIGLSQFCLDGATVAGTAVKLRSADWGWFQDLYIERVTANAWDVDVGATANVQTAFNHFIRTYADLTDASSLNANGWLIGPGSIAGNDTNRNYWLEPVVTYQNGTGFQCGAMDGNEIAHAQIEPVGSGTGKSLNLMASSSSVLRACRSNQFSGMFGVAGFATSAVTAESDIFPSLKNTLYLDQESGAPNPVINGAATLFWRNNTGHLTNFTFDATHAALLLPGYGSGCTLANDGTTPNTVIDVAACATADDTTYYVMPQTSAYTKTTGSWAVGSGNGCLDTGTVANATWYYLYQVQRGDTGAADYLCTATYGAPTMPTNYGRKRYIGPFKTDGSAHILAFVQTGNEFVWSVPVEDINTNALSTTATLFAMTNVPLGYKVEAHFRYDIFSSGTRNVLLTSPDETSAAVNTPTGNGTFCQCSSGVGMYGTDRLMTNTAQQIRAVSNNSSTTFQAATIGWVDPQIAWQH
ncbi:MAG TPA: hypothetical protein VHY35_08690 [Stellaceae bacterium]|nr:hypothetical protein [Stellaceae bacterium]